MASTPDLAAFLTALPPVMDLQDVCTFLAVDRSDVLRLIEGGELSVFDPDGEGPCILRTDFQIWMERRVCETYDYHR